MFLSKRVLWAWRSVRVTRLLTWKSIRKWNRHFVKCPSNTLYKETSQTHTFPSLTHSPSSFGLVLLNIVVFLRSLDGLDWMLEVVVDDFGSSLFWEIFTNSFSFRFVGFCFIKASNETNPFPRLLNFVRYVFYLDRRRLRSLDAWMFGWIFDLLFDLSDGYPLGGKWNTEYVVDDLGMEWKFIVL